MNAAAAETGDLHTRQRQTLTMYKPPAPAIPTDYNCPRGACATEPPPPPIKHSSEEGFIAIESGTHAWLGVMAVAVVLFVAATRLIKGNNLYICNKL